MNRTCPSHDVLADMLADRLPPDRESEIEYHLVGCDRCRERLDRLTGWDHVGDESEVDRGDTAFPDQFVTTVAAKLARIVPPDAVGRQKPRALPAVPGYELLAEIGRGGCGVVYRAVDRGLARTVALKVLQDRAGPAARERFRREAAALARLRHPNVVQIYGYSDEDCQPFLAIEYVVGGTLARLTAGQPQDPAAAAGFVEALARGVGAANQAGLVHRDLKPANVLLEPKADRSGPASLADFVPKVTDFGVVKSLAADPGLTDTRDFLGTPSYMAPEQAGSGRVVDRRADVYALGAIFYELLTGRPPFRAATPIDTLVQVAFDEPVPPARLQPTLPRDLETICLKCLEKAPARRYQTAEELADDLARFLEGRPVLARPIGWPVRAWRWCRRRPGWAAVAGLAASLLLILVVGGPIIVRHEVALRHQADEQHAMVLAEKDRARQNLDLASRALDETLGGMVANARLRAYGMDEVRADTLRGAFPYLEKFADREETSPDLQIRKARATIQLATVNARHGRLELAAVQYRRVIAFFEALTAESDGRRYAGDLANAHLEFGRFLFEPGATWAGRSWAADAECELRSALRIADGIAADERGTLAQRDLKAMILMMLARLPADSAPEVADRRDFMLRAYRIRESLVAEYPDRPDLRRYMTMTAFRFGEMLARMGQKQDAADVLAKALVEERRLTGDAVTSLDGPRLRSDIRGVLGCVLFDLGRRTEGLEHVGEARRTAESAAVLFPGEADYLAQALIWHEALALAYDSVGESDRAVETRRSAVALAMKVSAEALTVEANRDSVLGAHINLAEDLARRGKPDAAAEFEAAEAVGDKLHDLPADSKRAANRAECFRRLAVHDQDAGKSDAALSWLDRAVFLINQDPRWSDGPFRRDLETRRAMAFDRLGRPSEAAKARDRADRCRQAPAATVPAGGQKSAAVTTIHNLS
jgi:tetratricopeptide (TPR) repeat protein